jgi:hypothetical protein
MISVRFDPARIKGDLKKWWDDWLIRADRATQDVIDAWESGAKDLPFKNSLWSELKIKLLESVFHGKCGYCETNFVRDPGEAEHYRPKGCVTVKDPITGKSMNAETLDTAENQINHPGYFWLAYHWKNLFPACKSCNSIHGKLTQFPVFEDGRHVLLWKKGRPPLARPTEPPRESKKFPGFVYLGPDDLDKIEKPLLLNPYRNDPRKHLRFGVRGIIAPIEESLYGKVSIAAYNLEAERLRTARQREQCDANNRFYSSQLIHSAEPPTPEEKRVAGESVLQPYRDGIGEYSAAVLDYLGM